LLLLLLVDSRGSTAAVGVGLLVGLMVLLSLLAVLILLLLGTCSWW
jgi:hypothetical protein